MMATLMGWVRVKEKPRATPKMKGSSNTMGLPMPSMRASAKEILKVIS